MKNKCQNCGHEWVTRKKPLFCAFCHTRHYEEVTRVINRSIVAVRLPPDMRKALVREAVNNDMPLSMFLRSILAKHLDETVWSGDNVKNNKRTI